MMICFPHPFLGASGLAGSPSFHLSPAGAAGASFDIIFDTQSQLVKSEIVE